ncbi:ectoine/hydroxyectoine ABC transporter permease subunit EhuC [Prauserella marina]|uniref:Polar amino acid transport system permease protein n=1 Tax=Prauserella marina TaxID=530584 RepID=A0A222VV34_9PSEU|nr:ectoine/hydroxyectoine ABC transporter permease subunit EhuC [Prauserella marina]ASR37789.1 ectoine/hydroxyectoine ABC transporter permease subunit EhuC [Prauserella marina]PWV75744.1 polar amino acid transport system permease protein [Prauserella marina]SDD27288.1 polar amino acid transport system permease protein [Prauserella marina]
MFDNLTLFVSTIAKGLLLTVEATLGGIVIATVLSVVAGLAMLSPSVVVRVVARTYVEIWRGTSEVVQLLWIYFVLPILTGFQLVPLWAGITVLGLNFGAYGAEIVRGAVQAVPREQYEGCVALSLSPAQRMRRVILPQAFADMIPPFNNLFIQLLKGSALLTIITVPEITYQAREVLLIRHTDQTVLIFVLVLLFYLALSIVITVGMRLLERKAAARLGRRPAERTAFFAKVGQGSGVA